MLQRHDVLGQANVPEHGKAETSYPTPNRVDWVVIERVPIAPEKYEPLPYHSPHPDYDNNGLFLCWQGKVRAENNQISVIRIYANDEVENEDWYNASIKFSGDIITVPIYVRTYIELREHYTAAAQASKLDRVIRLKVLTGGTYAGTPTVTITPVGAGTAPTAKAIMNPAKTKVIALELLTPGTGLVANPTVAFSGGGQTVTATATAEVQLTTTYLVHEETTKLDSEDKQMASLFIKVHRVYETLPGPWLPDTRYDNDLGPIQMYRRAVLNTGQIGGTITATAKTNYASREGSAVVLWEIVEAWSNGTGTPGPFPYPVPPGVPPGPNPNPPYPILVLDDFERVGEGRGEYEKTSQIVVATGTEVGSETRSGSLPNILITKISYEPYADNPFLLKKIVEKWIEVIVRDKKMSSQFGGGILAHDEDTAQPGTQTVETGLKVVSSVQNTKSPREQTQVTERLDPSSAFPVLELTYGGTGYPTAPVVGFSGGTGSGASATAVLAFGIASVAMTGGGSDYTHPPVVRFTGAVGGGAFAIANLAFGVQGAIVTNRGSTYMTAPAVTVTGDGAGATATAILGFGVYYATITDPGGRAIGLLSSDNTNVADGATVTIGTTVYTFKTALTPSDYQVLIGASADASLLNLIHAINNSGGSPGDYQVPLAHPTVVANPTVTAPHVLTVRAIAAGPSGNAIVTTETSIHLSWADPTLIAGFSYTEVPRAIFDGDGDGVLANLIMGHPVSQVNVTNQGTGYTTAPTVAIGVGSGTGFSGTAVLGKSVASVTVNTPGSGYGTGTVVTIGPPEAGGVQAVAVAVFAFGIASVQVLNQGSGYVLGSEPTVGFGAGTGTGAAGTAVLGFTVASATITNAGTGYTAFPSFSISGGAGTGAIINIRLGLENVVVAAAGSGYEVDNILNIVGGTFTTQGQVRVTSVGGTGDVTGVSIETIGVYSAIASNPRSTTGGGSTGNQILTYVSDGDTNGVFYYLGTLLGTDSWINPVTRGNLIITANDLAAGTLAQIVDQTPSDVFDNPFQISPYFTFDLGAGNSLICDMASYRQRSSGPGSNSDSFDLEGSNNGTTWTPLSMETGVSTTPDDWHTFSVSSVTPYRYFRLIRTGITDYFTIGEFELYGDFDYAIPASGCTITCKYKLVQVNVTNIGAGYESVPGITIGAPGGGGTTATANAVLAATGNVKRVQMTAAGSGYTSDFAVTFSTGTATGTAIRATTGGTLSAINVTIPGSGYTSIPPVNITGGGGTGAAATAALSPTGVVWRIQINSGGSYELPPPTIVIGGGGGSGAAATAILDTNVNVVARLHVVLPGHGYTAPPTVRFEYLDGSIPVGLAATTTLLTYNGEVVRVNITNSGTSGYTFANLVFNNTGTGGTGAAATAVLATTGKVKSVTVLQSGFYRTTPNVTFEGGNGSGASANATLAATGSVIELINFIPGSYTVAPTVVFTGTNTLLATALYHLGTSDWPANPGFNTDPTNGIVIDFIKKVISTGTPYPGRRPFPDYSGPFIDQDPYDRWKTIQVVSSVDLDTLPPSITFPYYHHLHLPPRLLSIEALWSDRVRKMGAGFKTSAHADVSSGLTGDIVVKSSEGFHGHVLGYANRTWFLGPPPLSAIPPVINFIGSSGTVVLTETNSRTYRDKYDDGGDKIGDEFNNIVHAVDIRDHLIIPGGFTVINGERISQSQSGGGTSGGGTQVAIVAFGTRSFIVANLAYSYPAFDIRGYTFLVDVQPEQWRFNLWQLTLVYITIPLNS